MIKEIYLHNFKCFESHSLVFKRRTIIVGANNAGKSTIVEALRLVSIITKRYRALNFRDVPDWLDLPIRMRGVAPSLKGMEFSFSNLFHRYGDPPSVIRATFENGKVIEIHLAGEDKIHAVILDQRGSPIKTKGQANEIRLPKVGILPQIGPLAQNEKILNAEYVRSCMSSSLSTMHFRNQLNVFYRELFYDFKALSEATWPGFQIHSLDGEGGSPHSC